MSGVTIRLLHEFDYCVFLHFFTYQSPGLRSFDDSLKFLPPFDHLFLTSLIGQAQVQPRSGHHVCFFNEGKSNHALITSFLSVPPGKSESNVTSATTIAL